MKHLDKLVIRAKEIVNQCAERLIQAFIYPDGDGMWVADGRLWNGKKGSGTFRAHAKFSTIDEAVEGLNQLADKHPNDKPITIIIDDLEE